MRVIRKGATSQTVYFEILDSTSSTGGRKTGLVFNTSNLAAYYVRNGGSATAITLATLAAANSAWSSGGFKEVDATNMPGIYRLDVPDAAFASGADSVAITIRGATGMVQTSMVVQLTAIDFQDAVRAGLTALPNANAEAAGGLYTRGSGAGQIAQDANGRISVNLVGILGTTLTETAGQIAAAFKKLFDVASPVLTAQSVNQTGDNFARIGAPAGASVSADIAAVKTDSAAIKVQTDKLTFTVANQVDANALSMANGLITAAKFAANAITSTVIADGALTAAKAAAGFFDAVWSVATRLLTAGTNIVLDKGTGVTGFNDLDASGVRTAIGMAGANLDTQLAAIDADVLSRLPSSSYTAPPTANQNADALLDRVDGVETGLTLRQHLRAEAATQYGLGGPELDGTGSYRDKANTKNRVVFTGNEQGKRTAIALDLT